MRHSDSRWKILVFAPLRAVGFLIVAVSALPLLLLTVPMSIYWWIYPERHAHIVDFHGTEDAQTRLAEFRGLQSRKSVVRRILERLRRTGACFPYFEETDLRPEDLAWLRVNGSLPSSHSDTPAPPPQSPPAYS